MARVCLYRTRGAVLLLLVLALAIAFTALFLTSMGKNPIQARSDKATLQALAAAKQALIEWAVSKQYGDNTNNGRPGELPCPDRNVPGSVDAGKPGLGSVRSCNSNAQRIGRLPGVYLDLSDYKDGSGETLWYMVADPFQEQPASDHINSNVSNIAGTPLGRINAFSNAGTTTLTTAGDLAVAIVFAPGVALPGQNRTTAAQQTNPSNYLDNIAPPNATIAFNNASNNPDNPRLDGPISNAAGTIIFNDRLVVITRNDVMNQVRKRAAREYLAALEKKGYPSPDPPYVAGNCSGRPPRLFPVGNAPDDTATNWLNLNEWETVLTYSVPPCVSKETMK